MVAGVAEGEDAAVGRDEPVAGLVGRRADADDRALQGDAAGRPVELGGTEREDAAVGADQPVAVGVGRSRVVGVVVGVGGGGVACATSTEPMVEEPFWPCPRASPRWSTVTPVPEVTDAGTALTAGLAEAGSWVSVGPPLFARAPSCGLWPTMSPVAGVPQVVSSIRLYPRESSERR